MSQASASEKPAPAAGPLTAAITGKGMRRRSTIAWCRTSAPRRTSEGRSKSSDSTPLRNQSDVAARAEGLAGAGDDQRPQRGPVGEPGEGDGELADHLRAHRVEGVGAVEGEGADLAVDLEPHRLELGRAQGLGRHLLSVSSRVGSSRRFGRSARSLPFDLMAEGNGQASRAERVAEQRRGLPDSPGVYIFHGSRGEVLYVGKARSIRKRVASHFSGGETELTRRVDRIEFLVTANEAEALLAEQSFIKRHRPRFNIRLRDDKSYPYVGVSLDEDFPRVYFTRERHRPRPRLLRALLERQARARDPRPARQAVPVPHLRRARAGAALRQPLPRLLHQALRGALRRLRRPRGVPPQHRGDHRLPLRPLPPGRGRGGAQDGGGGRRAPVRARGAAPRPPARRSARCSSASASPAARSAPPT